MDYRAYVDAMQLVSDQVDAQQYAEAVTGLRRLLDSDLLDADKAVLCINMAVVHDKMGSPPRRSPGTIVDYERAYRRHLAAESKAAYLYTSADRPMRCRSTNPSCVSDRSAKPTGSGWPTT